MSSNTSINPIYFIFRLLLYPFALLYGLIVWLRNRLYDSGFSSSISFSIPIISVGNLSVGGTGKTPHVEYLIRLLQYQFKVATMSRGYKRKTQGFLIANETSTALSIGDEPMQYHMKYSDVVVSVSEERITGIPKLLQQVPDTDVILLDDAYQHRSVRPGVNILITDYAQPFYEDHILPYGRLRESRSAYRRADIIIVSKSPLHLSASTAQTIKNKIMPLPNQKVFFSGISYAPPVDLLTQSLVHLFDKNVLLVCCIAKPQPLLQYVTEHAKQVHLLSYADHHYFRENDLVEIKTAYDNWQVANKILLTTEKDATRLLLHKETLISWNIQLVVLPIQISILLGQEQEFNEQILNYVEQNAAEYQQYKA